MKINKKIVQEVLSKEFGVRKIEVSESDKGFHKKYLVDNCRLRYESYYVEAYARSYLELYIDSELVSKYEYVKEEGEVKLQKM